MATKDYASEIDTLKKDLSALRSDLSTLVDTLKEDAGGRANKARANARKTLENWEDRATSKAQEGIDAIEKTIEKSPITAMLAAIGLGFLIGALIRRD